MPETLPSSAYATVNSLAPQSALLTLLELTLPDASVVRLVDGLDAVTYAGNLYSPLQMSLATSSSRREELPTLDIRIDNATRALQADIELYNGLNGATVVLRWIPSSDMTEPWISREYQVMGCECTEAHIIFHLGATNPYRQRCPRRRVLRDFCAWRFKSEECGYTGAATTCAKSLAACTALANIARYGGFPLAGSQ